MVKIDTKLTGDMMQGLDKLAAAAGEATLRAAGFAGAKVFLDEAKIRVPVKSGTIKANLIIKRAEEKSNGADKQTYLVTVRSGTQGNDGDAYYWSWVENGHLIVGKKAKSATWKGHREAAKREFGDSKVGAKPFLRPAYTAMKDKAIIAMKTKMAEKIKTFLSEAK